MGFKIKKGDFVQVVKGRDAPAGKKGRVIKFYPGESKVLVEGVNFVKRHMRPRAVDKQGGIVQMEKPISLANVMYFCMKCAKPSRLGYKFLEDGSKARYCKRCKEIIEEKKP